MRVMVIGTHVGDIHLHDIEGDLWELQHLVGGFIECCAPVQLREQGIQMLANEEGLLRGLDVNENLGVFFFVGQLVMVGVEDDKFVSLTEKQQRYIMRWLKALDDY